MAQAPVNPVSRIPPEVADHLGFYVYIYVDPRDGEVFYVGKGQGSRVMAHLSAEGEGDKARRIRELRAAGLEPRLEILAHGLKDEESAFLVEAAVIDALGLEKLTNEIRGIESVRRGRATIEDLITIYAAPPVEIVDPAILIRINRLFHPRMTDVEFYEATRGMWKLGARREKYPLAMAVFEEVVREVYQIESWHPAATTTYVTDLHRNPRPAGRWEFIGKVAAEPIRSRYRLKSVAKYLRRGLQSPTIYVDPPR
jgi:uncharacterized protein